MQNANARFYKEGLEEKKCRISVYWVGWFIREYIGANKQINVQIDDYWC
jgi:hypothetical protein